MTNRALGVSFLALLSAIALPLVAAAESHEGFHFEMDDLRRSRVDDRGGQGDGLSFWLDMNEDGVLGENFCPHCRLAIMVADPGLDRDQLELLGLDPGSIETLEGLADLVRRLATEDPAALARELQPELEGMDLDSFVSEVTNVLESLADVAEALDTLMSMSTLDFDDSDLLAALRAMGVRMDSGFRADFSDPNDRYRANSGVDVYDLTELLVALETTDMPPAVRSGIAELLGSIPYLTGLFELSGDDDSVLEPASFHARFTNVTIRQRTYVVNNNMAYLAVYTVVNDTSRILPVVELAMIADFDIPPQSHDTATSFDPITQAVLVYDVLPYEDPEEHWTFGLAPAFAASPTPEDFVFAGFNIDDQLSLSQSASSSEDNRLRFFIGHPNMMADQDSATGKSEKQGAVLVRLPGPMRPGDQAEVAFCFGGAVAEDRSESELLTMATLEACRGLYRILHSQCGDSIIQYGEACDDGNGLSGDGCSASCEREVCGDGVVTGGEGCDDGNALSNDGCSYPACQVEYCGDGIRQAAEQCDDGNLSNTDDCLNTCVLARCGDGFVRDCRSGATCGCVGYEFCLRGRAVLDGYTASADRVLAGLVGVPLDLVIGFDLVAVRGTDFGAEYDTGPAHVELTGHPDAAAIASTLEGGTFTISLDDLRPLEGVTFATSRLERWRTPPTSTFALALQAYWYGVTFDPGRPPDLGTVRFSGVRLTIEQRAMLGAILTTRESLAGALSGAIVDSALVTAVELCDDGNRSDHDSCTSMCQPAACGDGFVQAETGEECDEGPSPPAWCVGCRRVALATCGNGTVEAANGETCDDGNREDGDGCTSTCTREVCGDGVVNVGEECDDGETGTGDGDGCTDLCVAERCGDGVVQPIEECDTGEALSDSAECLTSCRNAACGDGFVQAGVEECDDGNLEPGDGCNAACVVEVCGDGAEGPAEECDDGNLVSRDGCSDLCRLEYCGDGLPGPGEQCDDGNVVDGDGCNKDCRLENLDQCGNGRIQIGEQCDDGNRTAGDGCSPFCQLENPEDCGNGALDPGERCDDGGTRPGDGCSRFCTEEVCGDGVHHWGEECDDGGTEDGDGCSASCRAERPTCGDGVQQYGEQCDDGNDEDADGCTNRCEINPPGSVDVRRTCGDGAQDVGEECDDGGRSDGDGCDELCQLEASVCGNLSLEHGESCEDGNSVAGDGCGPTCLVEECGNGFVDPGEECDDGGRAGYDGCSPSCSLEVCGDGIVQPPETCDLGEANGGPDCPEDCGVSAPEPDDGCGGCVAAPRPPAGACLLALALLALLALGRRR